MFVSRLIPATLLVRLFMSEAQAKKFDIYTTTESGIYPSQVLYTYSTAEASSLDLPRRLIISIVMTRLHFGLVGDPSLRLRGCDLRSNAPLFHPRLI